MLFPSEAGGLPWGEKIIAYGTSRLTDFQISLERLKGLAVDLLCSDHYGYVAGAEARQFINASLVETRRRRGLMAAAYRRTGCLETAARELAVMFADEKRAGLVPFDVFVAAYASMIRHVVGLPGATPRQPVQR